MKPKRGPITRLKGYGGEVSAYLHRRRQRQSPRVRLHWADGTTKTLEPGSPDAGPLLDLAERLAEQSGRD